MKTQEKVPFRLIVTPCCNTQLCYVNPRLPNYCSECGARILANVRECIMVSDPDATLIVDMEKLA